MSDIRNNDSTFTLEELEVIYRYLSATIAAPHNKKGMNRPEWKVLMKVKEMINERRKNA